MTEEQVFLAALDLADRADRTAYLDEACRQNSDLRRQVEELLAAHERTGQFLDEPAAKQMAAGTQPPPDQTIALSAESDDAMADNNKTNASPSDDGAEDLQFLSSSTRPDSLGRLGHYEMLQVLGRGGFGIVFRAFDDMLQRVVAVKVMAPQIASLSPARKRFLREARSSAAVRHDNVVHVYEVGEQPLPYLVMEFIPGETLQQKLNRCGPLDVPEVLRIGRQIAEGLAAAHASDLIHRDIKPGNILLEGGSHKVKITDFGLARAADDASISQSGVVAGTPMFMSPEQALGHHIDRRADLFSFGSVLYQMASGRPPFRAPSALAVLKRVAEEPPRPITEIIPETPDWLCGIIAKLHAKNPEDRFQSAREVADLLADCEAKLKAKQEVKNVLPTAAKPAGRKWIAVAAIVLLPVIALAVAGFVGVPYLFRGQPPTPGRINPGGEPTPPVAEGWVRLFNGTDLTGWKTHPDQPGDWKVKDGVLVGSTVPSYLFSDEGKFESFHLRVEAKINHGGDSGIFFHAPFSMRPGKQLDQLRPAGGYEVELQMNPAHLAPTGSVWNAETKGPPKLLWRTKHDLLTKADDWFTLEIIAKGSHFITKVNGTQTADCHDELANFGTGHFALQVFTPQTIVSFKRIDIKELSPSTSPLPPTFKNSIGMEFVIVPKGKSWLGGGKDKLGDREVEIPADFYLGKYEVTQEEWEKVMGENPSHFSRTGEGMDAVKDIPDADLKRFPVEMVSWNQCQNFVARLNKLENETGWVYRLPTEVEWEYACRGGPMPDKLNSFFDYYFAKPTNTLLSGEANFGADKGLNRTCKVGSYKPNVLGLHDMHGNLWEWCDDLFDPKSPETPLNRADRGGSGGNDTQLLKATTREGCFPSAGDNWHGLRLARVPAGQAPLPPTFKNSIGMEFVIVPKGKAWLGGVKDYPGAKEVEIPADFYLGKYEVTQEEWQKVMGENPSWFSRTRGGMDAVKDFNDADLKRFPVEYVSWNDCQLFVAKLNKLEKEPGWVYRLPKEAEWEYACRGGPMADKRDSAFDYYLPGPTNTLLPELANTGADKGLNRTCKVGSYKPNVLGLYDMHGNVWEWCDELFDPQNPATPSDRVYRGGGSWGNSGDYCRAVTRGGTLPTAPDHHLGLRLARVPSGAPSPEAKTPPADTKPTVEVAPAKPTAHDTWLKATVLLPLDQHAAALPAKLKERLPGFEDAMFRTIPGMAADRQAIMVAAWLRDRNAAFESEITYKIEGGVLTSLEVPSPLVQDLTPLRALAGLKTFTGRGTLGYDNQAARDAAVLLSLKTLETINGKSVAQFWKDAEARQAEFQEWLKLVPTLTAKQQVAAVAAKLKERNPGFDGVVKERIAGDVVTELNLNGENLTDLSPLRALEGLTVLNCTVGPLSDLSPLKGLPLTALNLGRTQVRDLSPLTGMQLTSLSLHFTQVQNLEPLKGVPLTSLNLQFTKVQNLEPLKDMPLTRLHLNGCDQIRDLSPLKGMSLTILELYGCRPVRDLAPLKDMPLTWLHLGSCPEVRDLEVLKGMPLKKLLINNTGVTDLKPLQALPLEYIRLTPKNITQGLNVLRDMKSLKTIGVTENQDLPAAEFWDRYDKGEFAAAPFTDADVKRIAALPAADQIEEVRKELMKRNAEFDGKCFSVGGSQPTIKDGGVVDFGLRSDKVSDISPV